MKKTKTKWCVLSGIFLSLAVLLGMAIVTNPAQAQEETTFPVDEAGISAYVRLNSGDSTDIVAAAEFIPTIEVQEASHVIGVMGVTNSPHLYVGLDGWMVAYFLNTEEASRIAGGTSDTTLQDALDYMSGQLEIGYSTDIKYYDFEFPEANKLTLISEQISSVSNDFYVTVPGTLYEASYRADLSSIYLTYFNAYVDGSVKQDLRISGNQIIYNNFDIDAYFSANNIHHVKWFCSGCQGNEVATVLIYKN